MTHKWPYEQYCPWGRQMAFHNSLDDLTDELAAVEYDTGIASQQHLAAVGATHSMRAQSQRRAQTRNVMEGLYEKRRALRDAIEIYEHYPQFTLGHAVEGPVSTIKSGF